MKSSAGNAKSGVMLATAAFIALITAPLSSQAQDLGVCDAYQQLLKQTKFQRTPFCGRPSDGDVPGFTPLKRDYWDVEKVWPIFTHVYEFMLFDDQFHVQTFASRNPADPNKPHVSAYPITKDGMASFLQMNWMKVWNYAQPIDVENNGSPLNVLVWQGYGVVNQYAQTCGVVYDGHPWSDQYVAQQTFIISPDGKTIDEQRTRALFGAPEESSPARATRKPSNDPFLPPGATPFEPLADSIGIFEYHGRVYIETENRPKTEDAPLSPVVIYMRERGHTSQVCSIHLEN